MASVSHDVDFSRADECEEEGISDEEEVALALAVAVAVAVLVVASSTDEEEEDGGCWSACCSG